MSLFKKYLAEARAPTAPKPRKSKKIWTVSTQKAEKIIHKHLRMTPQQRDNIIQSSKNPDDVLASRMANHIHNRILDVVGNTDGSKNNILSGARNKLFGVRHVGGTKVASRRRKKILKIPNYSTGRPVEDIGASTIAGGKVTHHLIDLKLSPGASAGSWSARKMNMLLSGITRGSRWKKYSEKEAKSEIVPATATRQKSTKQNITKKISDFFNSGIGSEEKKRIDNMRIRGAKTFKTMRSRTGKRMLVRHDKIIHQLMNVHETVPTNVKRHQVIVGDTSITIHDPDHLWNEFKTKFKPTHYSFEHKVSARGGQTIHVIAHNENNEKFHLASIGVKHRRGKGEGLDYNIKHRIFENMKKKYDYNTYTSIPR